MCRLLEERQEAGKCVALISNLIRPTLIRICVSIRNVKLMVQQRLISDDHLSRMCWRSSHKPATTRGKLERVLCRITGLGIFLHITVSFERIYFRRRTSGRNWKTEMEFVHDPLVPLRYAIVFKADDPPRVFP